ncbi:MAG: GDYXXLXY domain-containing protein [Acidobacteriota bacterium]|nr:GDYXXLXY domain-containing protein [Acidobacteriota bacterium]
MKTRWTLVPFVAVCVVQLAVPAKMILDHERVLKKGELFLFAAAPVDPYDAFRGRFVRVDLQAATGTLDDPREVEQGAKVYAVIERDPGSPDGLARITALVPDRPSTGTYMRVTLELLQDDGDYWLTLPFDRYYMEEELAPEVERAWRENTRQGETDAWAAVRVLDGRAVLEALYIDGLPVRDYLERGPR